MANAPGKKPANESSRSISFGVDPRLVAAGLIHTPEQPVLDSESLSTRALR